MRYLVMGLLVLGLLLGAYALGATAPTDSPVVAAGQMLMAAGDVASGVAGTLATQTVLVAPLVWARLLRWLPVVWIPGVLVIVAWIVAFVRQERGMRRAAPRGMGRGYVVD